MWARSACSRKQGEITEMLQCILNLLMDTLKPLYRNTVIGTLTVVRCWYSEEGPKLAAAPPSRPLLAVPNVTAHPSTASVPTSYY